MKNAFLERFRMLPLLGFSVALLGACSDRVPDQAAVLETPAEVSGKPTPQNLALSPSNPAEASDLQVEKGTMQKLYLQPLEYPYSNEWFGYLKKSEGVWRDVYVETNDKLPARGILSFDCPGRGATGGTTVAFLEELDDASEGLITKYTGAEIEEWKVDDYAIPPYELYIAVQSKFC